MIAQTAQIDGVSTPIIIEQEPGSSGVNVIGKIDLSSINSKTRPDKKAKPEPKKEEVKPEPKKVEQEVVKAKEEPKKEVEKPVAETPKEEPKKVEETETIRATVKKLTGPNIVGKIVLPVEKPKTSSNNNNNNDRKKRKRVRKVDVTKQASQNSNSNFLIVLLYY